MAEQPVCEICWLQFNTLQTVGTLFIFRCFTVLGLLALMLGRVMDRQRRNIHTRICIFSISALSLKTMKTFRV